MKTMIKLVILLSAVMVSCKKNYTCEETIINTNVTSGHQSVNKNLDGPYGVSPKWTKQQVQDYEDSRYRFDEIYYYPANSNDSILKYTAEYITTCKKL